MRLCIVLVASRTFPSAQTVQRDRYLYKEARNRLSVIEKSNTRKGIPQWQIKLRLKTSERCHGRISPPRGNGPSDALNDKPSNLVLGRRR